MISFAVSSLIGGVIGSYSLRLTMYASAIGPFIASIMLLWFTEVQVRAKDVSLERAWEIYGDLFGAARKFVFKHRLIRWYMMFAAVLLGSSTWLLWLYQPYMKQSGLPIWSFGIIFASFNFFAGIVSRYSSRVSNKIGQPRTLVLIALLQIIPLFLMGQIIGIMSFLFIFGHQAVRGFIRPVLCAWVLKYTYQDKRATVLSMMMMGGRLFFAVTAPVIGYIGKVVPLAASIQLQGVILLTIFSLLGYFYTQIPDKYFVIKKQK